jgi:hypothetical protein
MAESPHEDRSDTSSAKRVAYRILCATSPKCYHLKSLESLETRSQGKRYWRVAHGRIDNRGHLPGQAPKGDWLHREPRGCAGRHEAQMEAKQPLSPLQRAATTIRGTA